MINTCAVTGTGCHACADRLRSGITGSLAFFLMEGSLRHGDGGVLWFGGGWIRRRARG